MIVLYKKRNKGVVGVQDKDGRTWHTKGAFEDRDAMKAKPFTEKGHPVARRRRRSLRRRKPNLMLHRTRNLGVVGTRGAGVIAWTKGLR